MAMATAAAAAAASIRSLLLNAIPTSRSSKNSSYSPLLSFSNASLLNLKVKAQLETLAPHRRLSSSSFPAAYTETDGDFKEEEFDGDEEEYEEEMELAVSSPPPIEDAADEGRLYVGNLPYSTTSSQLAEIFSQAGTVETVEIVYDRVTDRSRGFAFITMASTDDANNAIRMFNGSQVGGRTVKVNFPEVPRGGEREVMGPRTRASSRGYVDSLYKVYAGNLGWTVTSESLKDAFAAQPGLLGAKVIYEHDSGRSRGFGFISFASQEDAQSAIETMNGKEVEGRPLRLNLASERSSTAAAPL